MKYITDLAYDLKVYKHFFDEIDSTFEKEPDHVKAVISQAVLNTEGRKFMAVFDSKVKELEVHIRGFTKEEHEIHGYYLRKQLWDIIACTEFMHRVNIKPRGYAGDSEMMRMIYENAFIGDSTFSKILYKYSVEHPAAQAVRNRRIMVPRFMHDFKKEYSGNDFKFMSVACGPAYELQDLYLTESDALGFHCTLLDQDTVALREAFQNIQRLEKQLALKIKVKFIRDSVRTMILSGNLARKWGRFDFIYSMGLFDYLTPPVARAVLEKIYSLLEPGGRLLIGNYHVNNPSKWFMEYWLDWVLYYRTEQDFFDLLNNTDAEDAEVFFEDTNSQMFLTARKHS
jgi:extracellular factor (EF) 3-hydroxypalmitic acid methyl ester biosynthesis protein